MKNFIKISVIAVILVVVGILVFLFTLDINQYKPELVAKVSEQTGREFRIDGDLEIVPSLSPSITVSGISLGNTPWASETEMVSVGYVVAKVSLLPLLSGAIHINQFILHDTTINLEKNSDGSNNWTLGSETAAPIEETDAQASSLPPISIEEVEILNAQVVYKDGQTDAITDFAISEFSTEVTDLDEPVSFTLEAGYNDLPIILSGTVGSVNNLLGGDNYTLDINGELSGLDLSVNGSIANVMDMSGANIAFNLSANSLDELNELTSSDLPELNPFSLTGVITFDTPADLSIENFLLQLGESAINGTMNFNSTSETPLLTVNLQSDMIDLTPFSSETEEETEYLFPQDELKLQAMSSINADLSLVTKLLILPSVELADNRLNITMRGGNLDVNNESDLAGGKLTAAIGLRPAGDNTATLTTNINAANVMLELLPHEEDRWFVGGKTKLAVSGSGRGKSVAEIMGAYNGTLLVTIGEAALPNASMDIDMFGADILFSTLNTLNPFSDNEATTELQCAVINLSVNDGIIIIDRQIAVQTSKIFMVGSGEINLKTEALNLGVKPYAMNGVGLNLSSIAGAANIGGTLANPKTEINASNAIQVGVTAGAAVATGGISLLAQGLFNKVGNDPEPCNTALGISSADTTTSEQTEQAPAQEESGGNVINTIKGLFGK